MPFYSVDTCKSFAEPLSSTLYPNALSEIQIKESPIIARGSGSYGGDSAKNQGYSVLHTERLDRFLSFDEKRGLLRAESGITIEEIFHFFVPRGWFLPVNSRSLRSTLGGCIATDPPGFNHESIGSFGNLVQAIELYLADGTKRRCTPKQQSELFWATIGGMGCTGIISEVTVQLIPIETAYLVTEKICTEDLEIALEKLHSFSRQGYYSKLELHFFRSRKKAVVSGGFHARLNEIHSHLESPLEIPLRGISFRLWEKLKGNTGKHRLIDLSCFFYSKDTDQKGSVCYECLIPSDVDSLNSLFELLRKDSSPFESTITVLGKQGRGLLSFPKKGVSVTIRFQKKRQNLFSLLHQLDQLVFEMGGRVALASDFWMKRATFRKMYPKFLYWKQIKRAVDPNWVFSSNLSRRLGWEVES